MATPETWDKVKHFRPNSLVDQWGDPYAINDDHILRLDDFRSYINTPVIVTAAVKTNGHSTSSFHYSKKDKITGEEIGHCATDIVIPDYDLSPYDLILDALRFGFTGVGYYPHWKYKGKVVGGLHLDSRPLIVGRDNTVEYAHSRWMGVEIDNVQQYIGLSFENLLKYSNHGGDADSSLH